MSNKAIILVIDDEVSIHRILSTALEMGGYEHLPATNGSEGLSLLSSRAPDAVVLDLGLPDLDGKTVLERARKFYKGPILILSARSEEVEKIQSLDLGADDYVQKPFAIGELLARIRAALRKNLLQGGLQPVERFGHLEVDLLKREVRKGGEQVQLTRREYRVLEQLAKAGGSTLAHREILVSVWGASHIEDLQYLRIAIQHIRQKLEDDPGRPNLILTDVNNGYRLNRNP